MTIDSYPHVLLALCIWREARGCSISAKQGVLHVILNRISRKFRGDSIVGVITWPYQFSSFNATDLNSHLVPGPGHDQSWIDCCTMVDNIGEDPTGGALFYHSVPDSLRGVGGYWPAWATDDKLTATIGPFKFYRWALLAPGAEI